MKISVLCSCLLAAFLAFDPPTFSQNLRNIDEVSEMLEKAEVFQKYRHFRAELQQTTQDLGRCIDNYEDYQKLNAAYDGVRMSYNGLLEEIRNDLSEWENVQQMVKKPGAFSQKYLNAYASVINVYKQDFIPVYAQINAKSEEACDKAIPPVLIEVGIILFDKIVDLIKSRKDGKAAMRHVVLATVNHYFFEKLSMKSWGELDIKVPSVGKQTEPQQQPEESSNYPKTRKREKIPEKIDTSPVVPVLVGKPFIQDMSGWIQFVYSESQEKPPRRMNFYDEGSKDINVSTWKSEEGTVTQVSENVSVSVFSSEDFYTDGSHFQLKVKNTAGMYVFVLNSGNKAVFLYPPNEAALRPCDRADDIAKDIFQSTFITAKDENDVNTLPAPICPTADEPPVEQYFRMSGKAEREQFCILLSRSELDVVDIAQKIEAQEGPLDVRIARIFGDQVIPAAAAGVMMTGNRLVFNANQAQQNVLPIVFYIDRSN